MLAQKVPPPPIDWDRLPKHTSKHGTPLLAMTRIVAQPYLVVARRFLQSALAVDPSERPTISQILGGSWLHTPRRV